jgi:hypothetical protein
VQATFAIGPIDWILKLDQVVTDFYLDANFDIRPPINWQDKLDQGVTDVYVDTNFAIRPINWQLELDQSTGN